MQLSQIVQPRFNFAQLLTGVTAGVRKQLPRLLVMTGQERAKVLTSVRDEGADELTLELGKRWTGRGLRLVSCNSDLGFLLDKATETVAALKGGE